MPSYVLFKASPYNLESSILYNHELGEIVMIEMVYIYAIEISQTLYSEPEAKLEGNPHCFGLRVTTLRPQGLFFLFLVLVLVLVCFVFVCLFFISY